VNPADRRRAEVDAVHRALLEKWRGAMDLVGPGPIDPHFADAAEAVADLDARGDWVDLGSGAGFPGIALAGAFPAARVTLVERRQKRAAFLQQVVARAALANAAVHAGDAAELPAAAFDGVISRAYKSPEEVLVDAARLLRPGGTAVVLVAREVPEAPEGWDRFHVKRYEIGRRPRAVVAFRRRSW
jgi:16S rRNA (guanine(527)-N(7))-methyltransferase RsmG